MVIPTALLRRFYVKGSLRNTDDGGFEFRLKNVVAPTTLIALGPIEVDEMLYASNQITLVASKPRPASTVSEKASLFLPMGQEITVRAAGASLPKGKHELVVHAVTKEVGPVIIAVTESI